MIITSGSPFDSADQQLPTQKSTVNIDESLKHQNKFIKKANKAKLFV